MDAPSETSKRMSNLMNGGNVRLTPARTPAMSTQDQSDEWEPRPGLERFDTAPEPDYEPEHVAPLQTTFDAPVRQRLDRASASTFSAYSTLSKNSIPPPGSVLTGKQEHCMWRRPKNGLWLGHDD